MIGDILQPTHLLFILVIALLVLGPKRLPEVARSLGRGLRDFRSALNTDELRDQMISTTSTESATPTEEAPITPTETPIVAAPQAASTTIAEPEHPSPSSETSAERDASSEPEPAPAVASHSPDHTS